MVIDFHTHVFPEKIAKQALAKLTESSKIPAHTDGTILQLHESMEKSGISQSVILPVCTKASQAESINRTAIETNEKYAKWGIQSFGGIHPENDNYKEIIQLLKNNGVKGIKFHPVFQETYFDDIRYMRIVEYACEQDMIITVHGGYDVSFPGVDYVTPKHILPVLRQIKPDKLIIAHMGGWGCWEDVEELLYGTNAWLDTSFSLAPFHPFPEGSYASTAISNEQFCRIARNIGIDRVVFGTDSPWYDAAESIEVVKRTGLTEDELEKVFYKNALRLLNS